MTATKNPLPNILLILTDQWRADYLGLLGNGKCATPNLDRLAERSCVFTRAVTPNPVCQPARAALLTGRYPHQINLVCQNGDLRPDVRTVLQALQGAGYRTASCGKLHYWHASKPSRDALDAYIEQQKQYGLDDISLLSGRELKSKKKWCEYMQLLQDAGLLDKAIEHGLRTVNKGYHRDAPLESRWPGEPWPLPEEYYLDNVVGRRAVAHLRGFATDRPFYLQTTFSGPHAPYNATPSCLDATPYEEVDDFIAPPDQPLTDAEKKALWRNRHHYKAMILGLDRWVGKLIDILEERGIFDDTLIVFTSDHGEMLGDHRLYNKQKPYKESSRIPLIVKWPGHDEARRHDGMVELTDVSATILDAAGLEPRAGLDTPGLAFHGRIPGRSVRPIVTGQSDAPVRDCAFSVGDGCWSMVETPRWKLVRWVEDAIAAEPREELFDLEGDPAEVHNRVDDPDCREVLLDLREKLLRIYESSPVCQQRRSQTWATTSRTASG